MIYVDDFDGTDDEKLAAALAAAEAAANKAAANKASGEDPTDD